MTINWSLVHSSHTNINGNNSEISITPAFTGKYIIVFTDSLGANPSWYKAGYLLPFFDNSSIGRVYGKSKFCGLKRHTFIKLTDWEFLHSFAFKPVSWLVDIQIKIWSTADYALYDQEDRIEERLNEVYNILQN
ncbi:hypothetical protein [uncultured Nostoc sp.]|uniref:hypothetical protein n=1 Tax=uncultured Nostoc sp. TaxID=340711 RepID=UPI0035CAFDD9